MAETLGTRQIAVTDTVQAPQVAPPTGTGSTHRWDAPAVLYETGRRAQAASLSMRRHEIGPHDVCACGRLPVRTLAVFGPRCEVAAESWELAASLMRQVLRHLAAESSAHGSGERHPATGRAVVYPAWTRLR